MSNNREAMAILSELGIEVIAKNVAPRPGQTRSVNTIQRIVRNRGVEHTRLVLMLISESVNNRGALDETAIGAVSDVVKAFENRYPQFYNGDISVLFSFFDQTPLVALRLLYTDGLEGVVNKRHALAGQVWERITRQFGQPPLIDDRRTA